MYITDYESYIFQLCNMSMGVKSNIGSSISLANID